MESQFVIPPHPKMDAADTIFFQRELEHILRENFDPRYAELLSRKYVPVDNSIDPGAESVRWESFDARGEAKLVRDHSKDFPRVGVEGAFQTVKMESYGASFGYTIDELRAAAKAGKPLDRMRMQAARKTMDQKYDAVMFEGDSLAGTKGISNLASTLTLAPGAKTGGGTAWTGAGATADEILSDLFGMVDKMAVDTKDVEKATVLLLPIAQHRKIGRMRLSNSVSDTTVKAFFEDHTGVKCQTWERLSTGDGAGGTRAILYKPDIVNLRGLVAVEFEMFSPELRGMEYTINCRSKLGGVISPYPKSILYMDGV